MLPFGPRRVGPETVDATGQKVKARSLARSRVSLAPASSRSYLALMLLFPQQGGGVECRIASGSVAPRRLINGTQTLVQTG